MLSNKVAFGLIALVALGGAAGAGAYLASRQAVPPAKTSAAPPSTSPTAGGAVEATEAVMDDKDSSSKPAPAAPAPAAPVTVEPAKPAARTPAPIKPRHQDIAPVASAAKPGAIQHSNQPAATPPAETRSAQAQASTVPMAPPSMQAHPVQSDSNGGRNDRPQTEPVREEPPAPQFLEVTVPSDSVVGLQIETALSSDSARVEDRVVAHVTRDVRADGRIAIPAGSKVIGSVSLVDRGGRVKEQARLGVRFHTIILADGTELPLQTETIYREGESPANASAAKMGGGAIGGAILGAILGGGKGAAIGGAIGAAGGSAAVMAGGRKPAQIAAGSPVTVKVLSPVTVTVERE